MSIKDLRIQKCFDKRVKTKISLLCMNIEQNMEGDRKVITEILLKIYKIRE